MDHVYVTAHERHSASSPTFEVLDARNIELIQKCHKRHPLCSHAVRVPPSLSIVWAEPRAELDDAGVTVDGRENGDEFVFFRNVPTLVPEAMRRSAPRKVGKVESIEICRGGEDGGQIGRDSSPRDMQGGESAEIFYEGCAVRVPVVGG